MLSVEYDIVCDALLHDAVLSFCRLVSTETPKHVQQQQQQRQPTHSHHPRPASQSGSSSRLRGEDHQQAWGFVLSLLSIRIGSAAWTAVVTYFRPSMSYGFAGSLLLWRSCACVLVCFMGNKEHAGTCLVGALWLSR
jgi:hypothetical protein